ncbi:antitoxin [Cellulomonas sp. C5510]|uniref:antitoxin n=1 Tax=Cellulomonas sp. C5510 TaxID=2871170 RepID=UPI001C961398|nr:antitoxin [Cellulomonas sp. C5510]QZN85761.1 antitoxin [Cellulomonas sp. C5510]
MGIGDFVDRAKRAVAGNEDKIAGALDKAADAVKSRTSDSTDAKIDRATGKARELLEKQRRDTGEEPPRHHSERPDPPAL